MSNPFQCTDDQALTAYRNAIMSKAEKQFPNYRYAYGTRSEQWHLVGPDDRDYNTAIPIKEFHSMTEIEALAQYLAPSAI